MYLGARVGKPSDTIKIQNVRCEYKRILGMASRYKVPTRYKTRYNKIQIIDHVRDVSCMYPGPQCMQTTSPCAGASTSVIYDQIRSDRRADSLEVCESRRVGTRWMDVSSVFIGQHIPMHSLDQHIQLAFSYIHPALALRTVPCAARGRSRAKPT